MSEKLRELKRGYMYCKLYYKQMWYIKEDGAYEKERERERGREGGRGNRTPASH